MDRIDRKIVQELQRHGDVSSAELAGRVGASAASVWRRIKVLETAGVLGATVRLVNQDTVDLSLDVVCQVRMRSHDRAARAAFEAFVGSRDEVMECYSMSGEWDYMLRVVTATIADYERFLMRELLSQPSVATSTSHFALSRVKYTTVLPI